MLTQHIFGASVKLKTKISRDLVIKPPQTIPFSDSTLRDASHGPGLENKTSWVTDDVIDKFGGFLGCRGNFWGPSGPKLTINPF